jgi:hypothetical protein
MGTRRGVVAAALAWVVVGFIVWGVGAFGIARGLEDRCLFVGDERGYGASSQSASVWPPSLVCNLSSPDDPAAPDQREVGQAGLALLRSGWILLFPLGWCALGVGLLMRRARFRPSLTPDRYA